MNSRQRFLATMRFQAPDRVPLPCLFQQFEAETIKRWQREGLPRDVHMVQHFGFERIEIAPVNLGPLPGLEDEAEAAQEWRVGTDRVHVEEAVVQQAERLRETYPLAGPENWAAWKARLNPASPARYPRFWDDYRRHRQERDYPLGLAFHGPFTSLRDWLGPSRLARAVRQERSWVSEMVEWLAEFGAEAAARALNTLPLDFALIRERSAYQAGLLRLEQESAALLTPCYRRWSDTLEKAGVQVRIVEAPGNVQGLLPMWLEGGLNALAGVEASAGLDAVALRSQYGNELALIGNVDHLALAGKWRDIAEELNSKVRTLLGLGGYIPAPDRPVPSSVPLENYEYYLESLRKL